MGSEPDWRHSSSYGSSRDSYPGDDYFAKKDSKKWWTNERNEDYPKYSVDEFMSLDKPNIVYIRYRIAGGKMKMRVNDNRAEEHYKQWPCIELIDGDWESDYNNLEPCEWTNSNQDYVQWYQFTHPKPIDVREATRNWLDRRAQLHRKPGSYEAYLRAKNISLDVDDGALASKHGTTASCGVCT